MPKYIGDKIEENATIVIVITINVTLVKVVNNNNPLPSATTLWKKEMVIIYICIYAIATGH